MKIDRSYKLLWLIPMAMALSISAVLTSNYVESKPICPTCIYRMYEKGWQYYNKWICKGCNHRAQADTQERYGHTSYDLVYEWIYEREKAINAVKERIGE